MDANRWRFWGANLACAVLILPGCAKEDDAVHLSSESTTNSFSIIVEGPPCPAPGICTPLPDAHVQVEFRDTDHTDPHDGGYLMITEAQGFTNLEGRWSCRVTYVETGSYEADIVVITVTHQQFGTGYEMRHLDETGHASAVVRLDK